MPIEHRITVVPLTELSATLSFENQEGQEGGIYLI
jgi:hypothetical protein